MPHGAEMVIGLQLQGESEVRVTLQDHGVGATVEITLPILQTAQDVAL